MCRCHAHTDRRDPTRCWGTLCEQRGGGCDYERRFSALGPNTRTASHDRISTRSPALLILDRARSDSARFTAFAQERPAGVATNHHALCTFALSLCQGNGSYLPHDEATGARASSPRDTSALRTAAAFNVMSIKRPFGSSALIRAPAPPAQKSAASNGNDSEIRSEPIL